jgi:ectoine hydroxylase-related dioxygenase (phytanoyl-CoA dioxygenase family)
VAEPQQQLERDGFAIIAQALSSAETARLREAIEEALARVTDETVALRNRAGTYGARNVLDVCPAAREAWRTPVLMELLRAVLSDDCGLVRGLYFDKPPDKSWALPWHQDLTIAVADNGLPSRRFSKPTRKAGVPHVEAPREVLLRMLTLRIHLDDVTTDNGPLRVLPGTHREISDAPPSAEAVTILASAGDVLAMRPLLYHASEASTPGTTQHRRILHLEFAADRELPDGFAWSTFDSVFRSGGVPPPRI